MQSQFWGELQFLDFGQQSKHKKLYGGSLHSVHANEQQLVIFQMTFSLSLSAHQTHSDAMLCAFSRRGWKLKIEDDTNIYCVN